MEDFTYDDITGKEGKIVLIKNPRSGKCIEAVKKMINIYGGAIFSSTGAVSWSSSQGRDIVSGTNLIVFGSNNCVDDLKVSENFRGFILCFTKEYLGSLSTDFSRIEMAEYLYDGPGIRPLSITEMSTMPSYFELIFHTLKYGDEKTKMNISSYIIKALYYSCLELFSVYNDDSTHNQDEKTTKKFLSLVNRYGQQHRNLRFYSDQMCVTPKYLSSIISRATGKVCSKWLQDATMVRARFLLKESGLNIAGIAEELGFSTASDFSRYFRKYEGCTPLKFRNKQ